jgi:hypothetical protein
MFWWEGGYPPFDREFRIPDIIEWNIRNLSVANRLKTPEGWDFRFLLRVISFYPNRIFNLALPEEFLASPNVCIIVLATTPFVPGPRISESIIYVIWYHAQKRNTENTLDKNTVYEQWDPLFKLGKLGWFNFNYNPSHLTLVTEPQYRPIWLEPFLKHYQNS